MKTTPRYFALLTLALSCGIICLWVCQEIYQPAPELVASGSDKAQVSPTVEPGPSEANSNEPAPDAALQAADDATSEAPPESIPAADYQAGLTVLDELARDVANGRAPGEVFVALSADFSASMRDAAVRIFAGEKMASFAGFDTLPPPFVDALSAALRKQADQDGLSQELDTAWRGSNDPIVRQRLESLRIPGLYAARVAEFAQAGDTASARTYLARLETCGHSGTPDYLAALATQPEIDLNDLCDAAWSWAGKFPRLANPANLAARLTDTEFPPEQRIIAAAALAGAAPGAKTIAALDKAARVEPSAEWRGAFESVRDLVASPAPAQR